MITLEKIAETEMRLAMAESVTIPADKARTICTEARELLAYVTQLEVKVLTYSKIPTILNRAADYIEGATKLIANDGLSYDEDDNRDALEFVSSLRAKSVALIAADNNKNVS